MYTPQIHMCLHLLRVVVLCAGHTLFSKHLQKARHRKPPGALSLSLGLADLSSALTLAWISRAHSCQTNYSIYEMGVSTCVT